MPIKDFIHHYSRALLHDIPRVGAYIYDIPVPGHSFTTYPGWAQYNNIPGSEDGFTTFPVRNAVIRHALVTTQIMACPSLDAVLGHALVVTQFYDMYGQNAVLTCPGRDTVL